MHDGIKNIGLFFSIDIDHLGIASVLKIRYSSFPPSVLVVSQQSALGIGGKCCLSGSGKPQKQRRMSVLSFIGGTMQRQDILKKQIVVHDCEHKLLYTSHVS